MSDCFDLPAFYLLQGHDWSIHRPARTRCSPHWILSWGIPAERCIVTIVWNVISSTSELRLSLLCGCSCSCWSCCQTSETNDRVWCCEGGVCGRRRRVGWALPWLVLKEGEEPCGSGQQKLLRCCGQHSETHLLRRRYRNLKEMELTEDGQYFSIWNMCESRGQKSPYASFSGKHSQTKKLNPHKTVRFS